MMAPTAENMEQKTELQSIERLIEDLLQQQSVLCFRLASLEPVDTQRSLVLDAEAASADVPGLNSTPLWSAIVKGTKKLSLPLYDSFGISFNDITLSNFFSPCRSLPLNQSLPLLHAE